MDRDDEGFTAFVGASAGRLRRTGYLLCGDWHGAEDLVQSALAKVYLRWSRVEPATAEAYARSAVVRVFLDSRRRRSSRERPVAEPADRAASGDDGVEDRLVLLAALGRLPPGQRAAVVLRHWDDLSVEQVAAVLGLSPGTVKSQCSRGLAALRRDLGAVEERTLP